jgi:hypothetical protein
VLDSSVCTQLLGPHVRYVLLVEAGFGGLFETYCCVLTLDMVMKKGDLADRLAVWRSVLPGGRSGVALCLAFSEPKYILLVNSADLSCRWGGALFLSARSLSTPSTC